MFDVGLPEFFVLGLIALLVFGPERLPEVALQAARMIRKVRNMAESAKADLTTDLEPHMRELKELRELDPRKMARKYVLDPADEDGSLSGLTKAGQARQAADARRKAAAAKAEAAKPVVNKQDASTTASYASASPTIEPAAPVTNGTHAKAEGSALPPAMASSPGTAPEPPPFDSDAT